MTHSICVNIFQESTLCKFGSLS